MLHLVVAFLSFSHHRPLGPVHTIGAKVLHRRGSVLELRGGALLGLEAAGHFYAASLSANPIITKSLTAGAIFTLSDCAGQTIAPSEGGRDLKRTLTSTLVGLLYFGPALHYWLEMISKVLPGFDVKSTLIKTLLGQ